MNFKTYFRSIRGFVAASVGAVLLINSTGLASQQARHLSVASDRPSMIDSFLENPVDSTDELVAILKKDKTLRQKYAKHFNIPEERIIDFVKNALIVDHLKQDRVVSNYCITKSGRIYSLHQVFRKGTKVWALRDGTPILRWACANPLAKRLPMTLTSHRPRLSPTRTVLAQAPHDIAFSNVEIPEVPELKPAPVVPIEDPLETSSVSLQAGVTALSGTAVVLSGGFSLPARLPILSVAAASIPAIATISRPGSSSIPRVPEPNALLLMATGIPVFVSLRRRNRAFSQRRTH